MAPPITFWGDCRNAIEAAGKALSLLSLSSPRGYFLETIASLACFLELNHDPRHDEQALVILGHFSKRL